MQNLEVGDLEIFFRLGRQRVLSSKDLEDFDLERMRYFIQKGDVLVTTRLDPEISSRDESIFTLTQKGERDYKNILEYSQNKFNEDKNYFFKKIISFLQPTG